MATLVNAHNVSVRREKLSRNSGCDSVFAVDLAKKGLYGLVYTLPLLIQ